MIKFTNSVLLLRIAKILSKIIEFFCFATKRKNSKYLCLELSHYRLLLNRYQHVFLSVNRQYLCVRSTMLNILKENEEFF